MKFERNEIMTGLLVLATLGIVVGVILILAAPGLLKRQERYKIFFDNAAGIKPGAPVLVAGRQIGQVAGIDAPVAKARRPLKYPEDEVLITVRIDGRAIVYRNATARMQQNGLLGEQVIDFVGGTEDSGVAESGYIFVGERVPDLNAALPKILDVIEPVASTATLTLSDLRKTIDSLNTVFNEDSELRSALSRLRMTADNLATLTSSDGHLGHSLADLDGIVGKLRADDGPLLGTLNNFKTASDQIAKDDRVEKLMTNFESASERANTAARQAAALLAGITPALHQSATNFEQMTDTLKREPWRIIWHSTKAYPESTTTVTEVSARHGGRIRLTTQDRHSSIAPTPNPR